MQTVLHGTNLQFKNEFLRLCNHVDKGINRWACCVKLRMFWAWCAYSVSLKLTPAASTRIRASPIEGFGVGISSIFKFSIPPVVWDPTWTRWLGERCCALHKQTRIHRENSKEMKKTPIHGCCMMRYNSTQYMFSYDIQTENTWFPCHWSLCSACISNARTHCCGWYYLHPLLPTLTTSESNTASTRLNITESCVLTRFDYLKTP